MRAGPRRARVRGPRGPSPGGVMTGAPRRPRRRGLRGARRVWPTAGSVSSSVPAGAGGGGAGSGWMRRTGRSGSGSPRRAASCQAMSRSSGSAAGRDCPRASAMSAGGELAGLAGAHRLRLGLGLGLRAPAPARPPARAPARGSGSAGGSWAGSASQSMGSSSAGSGSSGGGTTSSGGGVSPPASRSARRRARSWRARSRSSGDRSDPRLSFPPNRGTWGGTLAAAAARPWARSATLQAWRGAFAPGCSGSRTSGSRSPRRSSSWVSRATRRASRAGSRSSPASWGAPRCTGAGAVPYPSWRSRWWRAPSTCSSSRRGCSRTRRSSR